MSEPTPRSETVILESGTPMRVHFATADCRTLNLNATDRRFTVLPAQPDTEKTYRTIDQAVRAVSAFESLAELKATSATYAPTFRPSHSTSAQALSDMHRVAAAFNAWALRQGRPLARVYPKPAHPKQQAQALLKRFVTPADASILMQPRF